MVNINYVADFADVADYFDVAYLLLSDKHNVTIIAPESKHTDLLELIALAGSSPNILCAQTSGLFNVPATWIVTSDYETLIPLLNETPDTRRHAIQRLFVVGGHANDYSLSDETLRIDPRLKEREPERFAPAGDPRVDNNDVFTRLVCSGEAVIWLPRDICLWRYAAPQIFELAPNPVNVWLTNRLANERGEGNPVLLSSFPAFCLSITPDTMPWLRLFHTVLGRIEISPLTGRIAPIISQQGANAYIVSAIDGFACGKFITNVLRGPAQ